MPGRERLTEPCPYCREGVSPDQPKAACDTCMAWHHAECWNEYGACAACAANQVAGTESVGLRCTWKGWLGTRPDCTRSGSPREGTSLALCPKHGEDFDRGRKRITPLLIGVLGLLCLLGSASLLPKVATLNPIPGLLVAGMAALGSLGLYMLWLAWSRWPIRTSPNDDPPEPDSKQEERR